jgi:RimJ/RimL family protein N-acetyltransferase
MPLTLETPRLVIRQFRDSDLEPFVAYRNDPEVYRYQGWKTPYRREDGMEFIAMAARAVPGTPGEWLQLAIERRPLAPGERAEGNPTQGGEGMIIGDIAFHVPRSNPRQAYLGYTLARSAWGQGYASEAARKLLDYLFRVLNLHRVIADCDVDNAASIRLLERLGFRREAHYIESFWFKSESRWGSEYLYAMLQREWILR